MSGSKYTGRPVKVPEGWERRGLKIIGKGTVIVGRSPTFNHWVVWDGSEFIGERAAKPAALKLAEDYIERKQQRAQP